MNKWIRENTLNTHTQACILYILIFNIRLYQIINEQKCESDSKNSFFSPPFRIEHRMKAILFNHFINFHCCFSVFISRNENAKKKGISKAN